MMKFVCIGCGLCCYGGSEYPVKEDGSCVCLTSNRRCCIYLNRPKACRIELFPRQAVPFRDMSDSEYAEAMHAMCRHLIVEEFRRCRLNQKS